MAGQFEYKFHAEMEVDLLVLRPFFLDDNIDVIRINGFGDDAVTIKTVALIGELYNILSLVPDVHVMVEMLALASEYTGDRTFKSSRRQN
jgi:hypothetical protein